MVLRSAGMEECGRDIETWRGDGIPERKRCQRTGVTLKFRSSGFIDRTADTAACDEIRVSGIDQPVAVGLLEDIPQNNGNFGNRFQSASSLRGYLT